MKAMVASAAVTSRVSTVSDSQPSRWPSVTPLSNVEMATATSPRLTQLSRALGVPTPRPGR